MIDQQQRQKVLEKLSRLRVLRWATDGPLLFFLAVVLLFLATRLLSVAPWIKPLYELSFVPAFFGFVMLFVQEGIKCPRCGKRFNCYTKGVWFKRNLFARKCMNCGLRLDGENIYE